MREREGGREGGRERVRGREGERGEREREGGREGVREREREKEIERRLAYCFLCSSSHANRHSILWCSSLAVISYSRGGRGTEEEEERKRRRREEEGGGKRKEEGMLCQPQYGNC